MTEAAQWTASVVFTLPFTPVSFARVTFLLDYHLDSVIPEHSRYYYLEASTGLSTASVFTIPDSLLSAAK